MEYLGKNIDTVILDIGNVLIDCADSPHSRESGGRHVPERGLEHGRFRSDHDREMA